MSTTLTPEQTPASETPPPLPPTRGSSQVIAILLIVFGAIIIVGTLLGTAWTATRAAIVNSFGGGSSEIVTGELTTTMAGIDDVDASLSAGSLRIEYADVTQAELEVSGPGGTDRWTLERDGSTLVVASDRWDWTFPWSWGGNGDATLRLPESAEGLDLDIDVSAGSFEADGEFTVLDLQVSGGEATLDGSAETLAIDISAGKAVVDLDDVDDADFSVSAGAIEADLRGTQPTGVAIDVSAGSVTLTVPEGEYRVDSDVSAGEFRDGVGSTAAADSLIDVQVSAGQVILRSAD